MRQCQRKADNLHFYFHKYKAEKIINKYQDDYSNLSDTLQRQFMLASTRYSIVLSDYLLQIGNHKEAIKVMDELSSSNSLNLNADTLLWLNYLSHQGAVRFVPVDLNKNRKDIEKGYDCLMQCYILASRNNIPLYKAVSMQQMSHYLQIAGIFDIVKNFDAASLRYINEDNVPDSLLAGNLAQRALNIFLEQKDAYLTIGAWKDLAMCYFRVGDAASSIGCLNNALAIPAIDSMPDLKASISEQMSMACAAINNKHYSDFYRNQYLDLQDSTRQDKQLEARAIALEQNTERIWILVGAAFSLFLMLCLITAVLVRLRHKKQKKATVQEEELEELRDRLAMDRVQCSNAQRAQVELRAQVSVINGMLPLIERMRNAIERGDNDYAKEVAHDIDRQNSLLTKWIKLQQGAIAPKIETFSVNEVFDIIRSKGESLKSKNNIRIDVGETDVVVKADKTLTLFIINTLMENARKAVGDNGTISVSCKELPEEGCAEISVSDNGMGMTQEQVDHLFEVKPIQQEGSSHGFGLQNCRGIINRYRKISSLFSVCNITAKSKIGEGTTISFRLPLILKMLLLMLMMTLTVSAKSDIERFTDSLYINNVRGNYARSMQYSDSCNSMIKSAETQTKLSIYNETAVAALALHQWNKYLYYNYLYTNLYKDYTEDASLPGYVQKMNRSELVANIAMAVVILLILALVPVFWFVYLRPLIRFRKDINRQKKLVEEECSQYERQTSRLHIMNNVISNQLSTIKHETMYYPSRISQMMATDNAEQSDNRCELLGTVSYYSRLYTLLSTKMIAGQLKNSEFKVSTMELAGVSLLANEELLSLLLLLLKRHNGGKKPQAEVLNSTDKYVTISFLMDKADFTENDMNQLFTIATVNTDYLVMRQIMREIGNSSLCYGTGIKAVTYGSTKKINVTFPQKNHKYMQ